MRRTPRRLALVLLTFPLMAAGPQPGRVADQERLQSYGDLVGAWRGTGQPQRGSNKGAWRETAEWAWELSPDAAALALKVEGGKFLRSARLRPDRDSGGFVLDAILADGPARSFVGQAAPDGKLVLAAQGPASDAGPRRITITPLHGTRVLLLLEGQVGDSGRFARLAEVGYTRQGVNFAAGDSAHQCIVTGGRGTTEVRYQGKTYWVCCSGCKDLFEDDPAAVLAEAAEKAKAQPRK